MWEWGHPHSTYAQKSPKLPRHPSALVCNRTHLRLKAGLHFSIHNNKWQRNSFFGTRKRKVLKFCGPKKSFLRTYATLNLPPGPLYAIVRIWLEPFLPPLCVRTVWMIPIPFFKIFPFGSIMVGPPGNTGYEKIYHAMTFKKLPSMLFHKALLKCFICSTVGILYSPWCNNSCRAYQKLGQGDFYSFDQEKVPFLLIHLLPTCKKCNHKKSHVYLKSCL